ncbi:hypothetical protein ACHAXR_008811 [Thalassiosira sp. AJA248-18]
MRSDFLAITWLIAFASVAGQPLESLSSSPKEREDAFGEVTAGGLGIDDNNDGLLRPSDNNGGSNDAEDDPYCPLSSDKEDVHVLNVHLVPHTHDDVGWLKTVDQYYYGLNNTIQQAHVSLILDNVLTALLDPHTNHNRTFTYVETKFFSKWYMSLPDPLKQSLKELIAKKQFSFANGGWCMHDEANTHFMGMIDQTTLGHSFLKKELGVVPTVGWQIDPFGHSSTQGGLMTSGVGFDALYFGRIHYVDLEHRQKEAECEGLWSSPIDDNAVFWGLSGSYGGNYGGPEGFCFDALCADEPLVGQPEEILLKRVQKFTHALATQANQTKGRNIMLTMGMDFFYSQAGKNFKNLDLLIEATTHFLTDGSIKATDIFGHRFNKVNIFYSTPERYTKCKYVDAVHAKRDNENAPNDGSKFNPASWKNNAKNGDFFPYADCDHCYWAGYFSSRQSLKRMERSGSSFLHAARQVESMAKLQSSLTADGAGNAEETIAATEDKAQVHSPWTETLASDSAWNNSPLYTLDDAMGVAQHHDSVTGTSKQHVAYDYAKRIAEGMNSASSFVTSALRNLLLGPSSGKLENLSYCHLLNETICDHALLFFFYQEASQDENKMIYAIVYNGLANARSEAVPLPVNSNCIVERLESSMEWATVYSTLIPNTDYTRSTGAAQFTLYFEAIELPPMGAAVFRVRPTHSPFPAVVRSTAELQSRNMQSGHLRTSPNPGYVSQTKGDIVVSNGVLTVTFDGATGVIKTIAEQREGGVSVSLQHEYGFYKAFFHQESPTMTQFEVGDSLKGNGICLPGYTDAEGNEMPWLLGTAQTWQNAGAYILRPTPDQSFHVVPPKVSPSSVVVHESDLVTEVHAQFGEWITQITRLIKSKDYVEVEYVVGPVPIDDGVGKEVVSRYSTTIESGGIFYTDSNGREFMKRKRGDTKVFGYDTPDFNAAELEPIAGNYFPVNTASYIEGQSRSFTVLVDRSQGGASLSDGSLELLIQRRLLHDDARGVGEALNETDIGITPNPPYGNATRLGTGIIVSGTHRLKIGTDGASQARAQMDQFFSQPHIFVASEPKADQIEFRKASLSLLKTSLPKNVMVVTYAALDEGSTFLVRLARQDGMDNSQLRTGEDTETSTVHVDLRDLFPNHEIVSISEKTLSANQDRSEWEKRRFRWNDDTQKGPTEEAWALDQNKHIVVLKPLEIRTFEVHVS